MTEGHDDRPDVPVDQMSKLMAAFAAAEAVDKATGSSGAPSPIPAAVHAASAMTPPPAYRPPPGWWLASDGNWYPPDAQSAAQPPALYGGAPAWSHPIHAIDESHPAGGRFRAVAIVALVAVVGLVAAGVVVKREANPSHVAVAPALPGPATGPSGDPATTQPAVTPTRTLESVSLTDLGGASWTDLGGGRLTAAQLAPAPPCPGQPTRGQDLSGTNTEFSYELQANGNEAGHLLSTVLLTSSAEAAARQLVYRQSDANIPCIELAARDSLSDPSAGQAVVSLSTTRASMQSVEPAAMWRVKAILSGANGHQFVVFQDAIRVVDGPYLVILIVNGCGCLNPNPNPAAELVPGEGLAIVAIGTRLHAVVGH